MVPANQMFIPLMTRFAHAARAHIGYEEQQVWQRRRAALPADKASGLGAKLARAARAAPTRPHPHTPPRVALQKPRGRPQST